MGPEVGQTVYTASIWILPVLIAITFHEAAHGFVAWRLGDDTAYQQGRVTFLFKLLGERRKRHHCFHPAQPKHIQVGWIVAIGKYRVVHPINITIRI